MSRNHYITLRQENERWGWSRHTVGMTFTSHATYPTRALAEDAARSIARCKDIPYLPTARGGFDRTPAKSPDPIDIAPPPPWLAVEEPAPAPPQSEQDALIDELTAAAIDAGHDRIIVLKAVDLVKAGHVFDLRFGGEWVVFSEQADMSRDDLWTWTPGIGSAPPAKRYLTSPQPDDGQLHCNCPNSWQPDEIPRRQMQALARQCLGLQPAPAAQRRHAFRGRIRGPLDARTERPPFGNRRQRRAARIHDRLQPRPQRRNHRQGGAGMTRRNSRTLRLQIARDALRIAVSVDPISLAAICLRTVVEKLETAETERRTHNG